jgi:integrase
MTVYRLKHLKRYQNPRTGIWYSYHRPSGTRIEPPHEFGTAAFIQAFAEAEKRHQAKVTTGAVPGTFGAMASDYKQSARFLGLGKRTKSDYLRVLDWLKAMDDVPISTIDTFKVVQIRNKAEGSRGWHFANYVLQLLSIVFKHGIEGGLAKDNPAQKVSKVKRPSSRPKANRRWKAEEVKVVLETAPPHLFLPIAIARWTGWREGDVIRLKKTAYSKGVLTHIHRKRHEPVRLECPTSLKELLDAAPAHDAITLCANSWGKPWTEDGFRTSFFRLIRGLEAEGKVGSGLTFHGLRTTVGEELAEMGFTDREIAKYLGHRSSRSTERYTRDFEGTEAIRRIAEAWK